VTCSDLQWLAVTCSDLQWDNTGWQRPIGCLTLQVIFRKRATNSRALLWKMTCKDKASSESAPPYTWPHKSISQSFSIVSLLVSWFSRISTCAIATSTWKYMIKCLESQLTVILHANSTSELIFQNFDVCHRHLHSQHLMKFLESQRMVVLHSNSSRGLFFWEFLPVPSRSPLPAPDQISRNSAHGHFT